MPHIILPMPHINLEHKCMILQIQHSKLDATKIDTESTIFAYGKTELEHANGFLDTTWMVSDMQHSKIDISEMDQDLLHIKLRHTTYQILYVTHKFAHNIN